MIEEFSLINQQKRVYKHMTKSERLCQVKLMSTHLDVSKNSTN